ncbi:glycosyltransferase family 87 protein [Ralstonia soli]|uniref:DUF2029 domain-containing protein n=1 Tax=Ralstonia soli TaxID=2953896 RepID=A0ABT1AJE8_9RALS|nr:glycosyltransferase family 87 protein [Ralstonia soli]MCO5398525.1 DUF2029 domain-containing protein [Ralstonia soli]
MNMTTPHSAPSAKGWLTPQWMNVYAGALLICEVFLLVVWCYEHYVLENPAIPAHGWDFAAYWSASRIALEHGPASAYDWNLLRLTEAKLLPPGIFGPFAYPPTFLLLIWPIGKLSLGIALSAFSVCGTALYLSALRQILSPFKMLWVIPALAFPGLWVAIFAGQNSLITLAAAGAALVLLRRNALVAGACIAMLCIKPQLGVLFPLFLLCTRQWAAIASAALFSLLYFGLTWFAFGANTFVACLQSIGMFRESIVENGIAIMRGAPTIFAMLRVSGYTLPTAYLAHATVSLVVIATCAWLWRTRTRFELQAAAFVVATLLLQPYLIYYDLVWLALPIAFLTRDYACHGCSGFEKAVLVLSWLIPVQGMLAVPFYAMHQWAPVVLIMILAVVARRALGSLRSMQRPALAEQTKPIAIGSSPSQCPPLRSDQRYRAPGTCAMTTLGSSRHYDRGTASGKRIENFPTQPN